MSKMEKDLLITIMQMYKRMFFDIVCVKMGLKSENTKNLVTNCGGHHLPSNIRSVSNFRSFSKINYILLYY